MPNCRRSSSVSEAARCDSSTRLGACAGTDVRETRGGGRRPTHEDVARRDEALPQPPREPALLLLLLLLAAGQTGALAFQVGLHVQREAVLGRRGECAALARAALHARAR